LNKKIGVLLPEKLVIGTVLLEKSENLLGVGIIHPSVQKLVMKMSPPDKEGVVHRLTQFLVQKSVKMMMPYPPIM
jgi:hypothetical protein